jgi:hypothetical protein
MAEKIGSEFAREKVGRGFRELGGVLYPDSNIAQPTYPIRGPIIGKEIEKPVIGLDEHQHLADQSRDDKGRDERDDGMDRG